MKDRALTSLFFYHNGTNINRLTFAFPDSKYAPPQSTYDIEPTTELKIPSGTSLGGLAFGKNAY